MATKLYEAMFVVDAARGGSDFPDTVRLIAQTLQDHGAEIERIERWAERKFAYTIKGSKRGFYILVYFRAEPDAIADIREDVALSEDLLRVLILLAEHVSPVTGDLFTPDGEQLSEEEAAKVEAEVTKALGEQQEQEEETEELEEAEAPD